METLRRIRPNFLQKGAKVRLIAPARKVTSEEMLPAIQALKKQGWIPELGDNLYASDHQFGGTDEQRLSDLQAALDDPNLQAIWCARGGYGALRILPNLKFEGIRQFPKWLIGFSDITVIQSALVKQDIISLHGPMAFSLTGNRTDATSIRLLWQTLKGNLSPIQYRHLLKPPLIREGIATAPLIGGNLSLLNQLSGTPWQPDTRGCILFLEDLDEYLYHIDRMLRNLKAAGWLDHLAGLVVGSFSDLKDHTIPFGKNGLEIIAEIMETVNCPIAWYFPAGHEKKNYPLMIGETYTLEVKGHTVTLSPQNIKE